MLPFFNGDPRCDGEDDGDGNVCSADSDTASWTSNLTSRNASPLDVKFDVDEFVSESAEHALSSPSSFRRRISVEERKHSSRPSFGGNDVQLVILGMISYECLGWRYGGGHVQVALAEAVKYLGTFYVWCEFSEC